MILALSLLQFLRRILNLHGRTITKICFKKSKPKPITVYVPDIYIQLYFRKFTILSIEVNLKWVVLRFWYFYQNRPTIFLLHFWFYNNFRVIISEKMALNFRKQHEMLYKDFPEIINWNKCFKKVFELLETLGVLSPNVFYHNTRSKTSTK